MPIPEIAQPASDIIRDALHQAHELGRMPSPGARFHHGNACMHLLQQLDAAGFEIARKGVLPEGVVRIHKSDCGRVETRIPDIEAFRERWENGFRNIVQILHGGSYSFDIPDIVEEVRALKEAAAQPGIVALLTPEGERIVSAFASKDWSGISDRDYRRFIGLVDRVLEGDTTSAQIRELAFRIVNKAAPETLDAMRRATYATAERPITPEDFTGPIKLEPGKVEEGQESAADLARRVDPSWCYRNDPTYRARHDQAVRNCLEASRLTYAAAEVIGHAAVSELLNSAEPPATDAGEAA